MKKLVQNNAMALLMVSLLAAGCGQGGDTPSPASNDAAPKGTTDAHDHDHPTEGPHGGTLVELGNEAYHAELVHNEQSNEVTVYVLDGSAKNAVAIAAPEVTINMTHDGDAMQFKLTASPDQGDAEGLSSRFVSTDPKLGEELHHGHAAAQLVLNVEDKQYRGAIEHHEHDHAHAEDEHKHEK